MAEWALPAFLAVGVAAEGLCALGLLLGKTVYARLHFVSAASLFSVFFIAAALLSESFSMPLAIKCVLLALVMIVSGPVVVHATARAAHIRERKGEKPV